MKRKPKGHRFGVFGVRGVRVVGGWSLPVNSDPMVKWKDVTADEWGSEPGEPKRVWPQMRDRRRKR